jgi:hypothetical protein
VLLDRGRREMALQILHEGGDVEGLYVGELGSAPSRRRLQMRAPRRRWLAAND